MVDHSRFSWNRYCDHFLQNCSNYLLDHECNSEEEVTAMKDAQIKRLLEGLHSSIAKWDSRKCPTVKAHIDRMKKSEGIMTEEKECPEPEAGGAMMATSTSLLTITFTTFLAIFRLTHL